MTASHALKKVALTGVEALVLCHTKQVEHGPAIAEIAVESEPTVVG
ncbi:MAG TPA: hypothetical protein VF182_14560 [Candidatus Binatia bacterium]